MSYRGSRKSNYTNQPKRTGNSGLNRNKPQRFSGRDLRLAKAAFSGRSERSQTQDLSKQAPLAPELEVWLKSPATLDFPGVDTKLSTDPTANKKQASELAQIAAKKKIEIEVRNPKDKKPLRRFRVIKKEDADKIEKEQEKKAEAKTPKKAELKAQEDNSPFSDKSRMPSHKEIIEKAQQLWMADNGRFQDLLGTNLPEESELREEGYLKKAQLELLTKEDTKATRQVLDYVGNLKNELEQIGFTIIPIEGFTL